MWANLYLCIQKLFIVLFFCTITKTENIYHFKSCEQESASPNMNFGFPHQLSASTVSIVCTKGICSKPTSANYYHQQQIDKDISEQYYMTTDHVPTPPPPPSSCSQIPQPLLSPKNCALSTDCKCISPSQNIIHHDSNPRFQNGYGSNGVEQRVIFFVW